MTKEKETKEEAQKADEEYQGGGAYKAILGLFASQLDDDKFAEHCRKFFKGDNADT